MRSEKIFAIIPARGGSKGVPKKNIRPLAGFPLIAYSIAAARLCPRIDRVVVSTDSEEIAALSRKYGAETPFMRPVELATDRSPDREFVMHALEWFDKNEHIVPDYLVHLRPTTPLRDPRLIAESIEAIIADPQATSLRSGHQSPESPLKWFMRDEQGYFYGFNPGDPRPGFSNLPRQAFPPVYIPDGYVDVLRTSFLLHSDNIHGHHMIGYVSPMCHEIDTLEDIEFLEFEIRKKGSALLDFLKTNYPQEV